jgi:hypothetical protein
MEDDVLDDHLLLALDVVRRGALLLQKLVRSGVR